MVPVSLQLSAVCSHLLSLHISLWLILILVLVGQVLFTGPCVLMESCCLQGCEQSAEWALVGVVKLSGGPPPQRGTGQPLPPCSTLAFCVLKPDFDGSSHLTVPRNVFLPCLDGPLVLFGRWCPGYNFRDSLCLIDMGCTPHLWSQFPLLTQVLLLAWSNQF